jgi:alkylation response protein AidB-like acyl-CoA dehydrogenase
MRRSIDFLLYDWLRVHELAARPRFADHSRETFDSVLDTCARIADECFAPSNRRADVEEPRLEGDRVVLPESSAAAARAYADSGMLAAAQDYGLGGMQLPLTVQMAANAFFWKASVALGAGAGLTVANANLLLVHGQQRQKSVFAAPQLAGHWSGTMCLSETQAGSSLSDIATRATPDGAAFEHDPLGPRYRLHGSKMWISNGDHELTANIVHLVLAKVPDARGMSLFIVPKWLVDADGALTGERNDVATAGLNHKLGFRGIPNALLNFGEGRYPARGAPGAIGYLVGRVGDGLRCMFHMMNEARIGVGVGAVALGQAGYEASLAYARERRQGRPPGSSGKSASTPQVRIIEHADVRRMLLAQKSYVHGGLALALYCARLVDEENTGDGEAAAEASRLLEILTPIVKSWPSQWCLEANSLAIQVHGGYGYTRDFPVEQFWRDNRLNMIHEGTHGIQGIDLLGRKVVLHEGRALALLLARMRDTAMRAASFGELAGMADALREGADRLEQATRAAWAGAAPLEVLANATHYLEGFGHTVIAWIWLDVATMAVVRRDSASLPPPAPEEGAMLAGLQHAARYFFDFELPKTPAWFAPVAARNALALELREEWL